MGQIHITVSDRAIERTIFILIILVLAFFAFGDVLTGTSGDQTPGAEPTDTGASPQEASGNDSSTANGTQDTTDSPDTDNATDSQTDAGDTTDNTDSTDGTDDTTDTTDDTDTSETEELSGEVDVEITDVVFDTSNRTQIDNIQVRVENGKENDVLLFSDLTIVSISSQNFGDIQAWQDVRMESVASGETSIQAVSEDGSTYVAGASSGDRVTLEGVFTTQLQGENIRKNSTITATIP